MRMCDYKIIDINKRNEKFVAVMFIYLIILCLRHKITFFLSINKKLVTKIILNRI